MENPVTVHATPYQTLSVPDQRRMTISYVSPARRGELDDLVAVVPRRRGCDLSAAAVAHEQVEVDRQRRRGRPCRPRR